MDCLICTRGGIMESKFSFTFKNLENNYIKALSNGYKFIQCYEYPDIKRKQNLGKIIVNRVDIDQSPQKAKRLLEIFNRLNIKATFFIRLHSDYYNPFSYENYKIIKAIIESGHEIGYHSEIIDIATIWKENAEECLKRDIEVFNTIFRVQIKGIASHGGRTGLNNLDFWKNSKPENFGMLYEAYDKEPGFNLFDESFYISDSSWTYWKCYDKGTIVSGDYRTFGEHIDTGHQLIYLLIHPETYYDEHPYE